MAKKILVVDDEADIRYAMETVLGSAGYEVTVAVNGNECLEKLHKEKFDLVLMDVFMPGLSGRETFERIIKDKNLKKTKVAFFTVAQLGVEGKKELEYLGLVDYIEKGIKNEALVKRIKNILEKKNN
jgi:CheY-like chemotaxis protein